VVAPAALLQLEPRAEEKVSTIAALLPCTSLHFAKDVIFNDLRQIIERDQLQGLHPAEAEWKELFEI